ncbi:MAG: SPOR domain-containing protein [Cytophagales bacterium]|nr:SPOR domain-containing protein [Cytophagales bacterium]
MKPLTFLTFIIFFSSCSSKVSSRLGTTSSIKYEEDLSIVRPEIKSEVTVEENEPKEEMSTSAFKMNEPQNENSKIELALREIGEFNSSQTESAGFRIQIFSGNSRAEFDQVKGYIMQHFPELEIYESYSQPTYRVKVGDFLKRMDAERYYSSLLGRFSAAKITMETINIQRSFAIN